MAKREYGFKIGSVFTVRGNGETVWVNTSGWINDGGREQDRPLHSLMSPADARGLAERLIEAADKAEGKDEHVQRDVGPSRMDAHSVEGLRHILYGSHGFKMGASQRAAYVAELQALDPFPYRGCVDENEHVHDVDAGQRTRCGIGRADIQAVTDADCQACIAHRGMTGGHADGWTPAELRRALRRVEIDPGTGPVVQRAYRKVLDSDDTTAALQEIADEMNDTRPAEAGICVAGCGKSVPAYESYCPGCKAELAAHPERFA